MTFILVRSALVNSSKWFCTNSDVAYSSCEFILNLQNDLPSC